MPIPAEWGLLWEVYRQECLKPIGGNLLNHAKRLPVSAYSDFKKVEIRKLNSLRGLAALIVVISHFSNHSHLFNGMLGQGAGQLGVMLFFIARFAHF
jgi:hypothetical protein